MDPREPGAPADPPGERDDSWHESGGEPDWAERLTFALCDTRAGAGLLVRAEALPAARRVEAWLAVLFPDQLLTVLCRGDWPQAAGAVRAGRLALESAEPMRAWNILCSDTALVLPVTASGIARKGERTGATTHVAVDARFLAAMPPAGGVRRATDVSDEGFVRVVSSGLFEQAGNLSGTLRAGRREIALSGWGVRERAWGSPGAPGWWISAAFDEDLALALRVSASEGRHRRSGWVRAGGVTHGVSLLRMEVDGGERAPAALRTRIEHDAGTLEISGEVIATLPGREAGGPAHRCLVRYRCEGRETLGFAEIVG